MSFRGPTSKIHQAIYGLKKSICAQIKNMTIAKLMSRNAKKHSDEIAICYFADKNYQSEPVKLSWKSVHRSAQQLAAYILNLKITLQPILIMSRNRPEHFIADLAALYSNNTPCSVYTTQTAEQIHDVLAITHASMIIVDDCDMYREARAAARLYDKKLYIICIERPRRLCQDSLMWAEAMHYGEKQLQTYQNKIQMNIRQSKPKDPVCIIFTSGTTGKPKGAILTNENVLFAAASIQAVGTAHIQHARLLSYLPLAHVFERVVGYYGGIYSRHILYCVWSVNDLPQALIAVRPSIFVAVPRIYEKIEQGLLLKLSSSWINALFHYALLNGQKRNQYLQHHTQPPWSIRCKHSLFSLLFLNKIRKAIGLDQCQLCLSGSAPLDPNVIDFFSTLNLDIVEGYGLTENSAPAAVSWNIDILRNMTALFQSSGIDFPYSIERQFGRVGYPMPGTQIKIDRSGLIHIRGPHVFDGYLHDAKHTHAALVDSWLRTGDLGTIHKSGELEIVGRKKDIIILSNGKNIAPRKIESMLMRHPMIAHVCLVGDGKAYLIAVICMRYDGGEFRYAKSHKIPCEDRLSIAQSAETIRLIQQHVDRTNQHFCRPEQIKYFHITDDIWSPKSGQLTPTLKLKRPEILQEYGQHIEKIYREHDPSNHHRRD